MYNHAIMRLSYKSVFIVLFCAGVTVGGIGGLFLGLLERNAIGILGGLFVGLVLGLGSGAIGLIYTFIFNALAPLIGGIKIRAEAIPAQADTAPPSLTSKDEGICAAQPAIEPEIVLEEQNDGKPAI